jgi:hypothetical protein
VVFSDTIIEIFGCRVLFSAGILEQSMGARNRVGIGLLYRDGNLSPAMGARSQVGIGLLFQLGYSIPDSVPGIDSSPPSGP